jgi:hypothetical protein
LRKINVKKKIAFSSLFFWTPDRNHLERGIVSGLGSLRKLKIARMNSSKAIASTEMPAANSALADEFAACELPHG